jgi:hypothetical protein
MDNVVLTSDSDHPLEPSSTVDALVENPLEPIQQDQVDGNFQTHLDINYQAHDVALAEATKGNGHVQANGLKLGDHHEMEIDDGYENSDKAKPCCSAVNKLFLALAIVCFALFLCSIAFIVANIDGVSQTKACLFVRELRGFMHIVITRK